MPVRMCIERGCGNVATGRGRCDEHRKALERERSRRHRAATAGVYKRKLWERRRFEVLARDGFCADGRICGGKALSVEVDHVVPLAIGGDPYDVANLRGTCRACHEAKTASENRRRR